MSNVTYLVNKQWRKLFVLQILQKLFILEVFVVFPVQHGVFFERSFRYFKSATYPHTWTMKVPPT
jgi:hypothetical protein